MKYLQRYLSLLFALVMCVGLFSTTAHAESLSSSDFLMDARFIGSPGAGIDSLISISRVPASEFIGIGDTAGATGNFNSNVFISTVLNFLKKDGTNIIDAKETFTYTFSNLRFYFLSSSGEIHCRAFDYAKVILTYDDNTTRVLTPNHTFSTGNLTSSFTGTVTAQKNVRMITLDLNYYPTNRLGIEGPWTYGYYIETAPGRAGVKVEIDSKEVGLLQDIGNKLTDGFNNMIKGITELPQKLWEKISDGLKGLFVPSEESMTAYKDKWDELLSSRFGAVYQVVNIMTDSWDGIMQADQTDTISFPQATLNFSGTPFTFGGYDVKIVPDGFDVLVTAIKSIVAIVCTVAFVNGLRKRYDEIMGVEQ